MKYLSECIAAAVVVVLTALIIGATWYAVNVCAKERETLIAECEHSGRPAWECRALFAGYCKATR